MTEQMNAFLRNLDGYRRRRSFWTKVVTALLWTHLVMVAGGVLLMVWILRMDK